MLVKMINSQEAAKAANKLNAIR